MGDSPDVELQMDLVREAHHAQVFRLMVQDLEGRHSTERISDFLSELADRVLGLVIDLVWSQLRQRYCDPPRFAAIAYGRLGGKELGYASDLDLVFLFEDDDERATEAYSLLAQRTCGWLSTRTAAGLLFETDLRLRPNGQAGLLASTVEAFERYQRESAWVWEHQALSRARFAAGDTKLGERFEAVRRSVLASTRDTEALAREVIAMRRKMHDGHPNRSDLFDLKHDRGGMVDIEFIVQYLVLAHSATHQQLLDNAGNIALLGRAADAGLIDNALATRVANAYRRYRQLQHKMRLNDAQYARVAHDEVVEQAADVLALWQQTLERAAGNSR
jgi:glutamate-ammonia-ligase adenylyltransferase